jgi:hypothetical protein
MPGGDLHHEQDVEASEGNRVQMEEVAGQQPLLLSARERSPGGAIVRGAGLRRRARRIRCTVAALMR